MNVPTSRTVASVLLVGCSLVAAGCSFGNGSTSASVDAGGFDAPAFDAPVAVDGGTAEAEAAVHEAGVPSLAWSPSSQAFGSVAIGAKPTQSLTLTNTGTAATGALTLAWTGPGAAAFALGSDACTGKALAPQATCAVVVTFDPAATGQDDASLTASAGPIDAAVAVSGTAVTPSTLAFTTPSAFGPATVGQSVKQTLTLTNSGARRPAPSRSP